MAKIFYVYKHVDADGSVVYIGKGKHDRAWSVYRNNPEHVVWLTERKLHECVEIFSDELSEEEALQEEKELIKELQPKFNKHYTEKHLPTMRAHGSWLASEKSRFNESELQTELGIRAAKSPNHPNNRLGKCDHCKVEMNLGHISRYHNDNCKKRVSTNDTNWT